MWTEKFQMYKLNLEKAKESEIKLPISAGSSKKQEICKKCQIYFCFIDYTEAFDFVVHNKLWIILKEMGIADHITYLLRNLCASQEATVRTRHGTIDWFKIGKGVHQVCTLSPYLFNLCAECIMWNARLDDSQTNKDCQEKYQQSQILQVIPL